MIVTVLGSGTSHGVPVAACGCPVCRSNDAKDKRMRASVLVRGAGGAAVVIDTGPEFRLQVVRAALTRLDAVLLTHAHADHLHGLDDVRPLCREKPLPIYGSAAVLDELRERFAYVFRETQQGGGKPKLDLRAAVDGVPITIGGLVCTPVPVKHGGLDILAWKITEQGCRTLRCVKGRPPPDFVCRHGRSRVFLYMTDTSAVPEPSFDIIHATPIDVMIVGGLRMRPHVTHFSFEQALETASACGAKHVRLTHLCHDHFHTEIAAYCRAFMKRRGLNIKAAPAWDGLEIEV